MRSSTILLALVVGCGWSVNAAEITPANRFGSPHAPTASRVPLLPGPYLLSPAGTPSLNGRTWTTIRFSQDGWSAHPISPASQSKARKAMAPRVRASAPGPAADTLRFDGALPKLDTSLPAAKAKSQ